MRFFRQPKHRFVPLLPLNNALLIPPNVTCLYILLATNDRRLSFIAINRRPARKRTGKNYNRVCMYMIVGKNPL